MLDQKITLNMSGRLLVLDKPAVMGIINVTPDSFFDGGKTLEMQKVLNQAEKMLEEGALILDIGGASSRPGALEVSEKEELKRVVPAVREIARKFPQAFISVDTWRAEVAKATIEEGASMINDISAGRFDRDLWQTVASLKVPYVLMHMLGRPADMQNSPVYGDVLEEVLDFMILKVRELRALGIVDILIDPGFGFGKTVDHNFDLLGHMHVFQILECPLMAGISRKSMVCKVLRVDPEDALNGTTALHMVALQQGAKILRVHDVKQAREVIRLWETLESGARNS